MTQADLSPTLGALLTPEGVRFRVWAPVAEHVELLLEPSGDSKTMTPVGDGYVEAFVAGLREGARYRYRLDSGPPFPDPASRFQPEGVHGPSEVVDPGAYRWQDHDWQGVPQESLVFYELHVGTFTPEGSYRAAIDKLPYLKELGVTALELMPLHDFPGGRNWGYDPAAFFAPARAYGTPDELRALVDAAHAQGLSVFLDIVYNHLGPDGAYLAAYTNTLFTDRHVTPWGRAINLDGEGSQGVRRFFLENALHWLSEYHLDGFRLDAVFALIDDSPKHFLAELSEAVAQLPSPPRRLIAEDYQNNRRMVTPRSDGGHGLDGVWSDDFHHQLRRHVAGDHTGHFANYAGTTRDLATTIHRGWLLDSKQMVRPGGPRGTDPTGIPFERFVYCTENHDQVGNRPRGDRLAHDVSSAIYRACSALLLFCPQLPLLFMGQEWAASTPFYFFTDHHRELGEAVRKGRAREFEEVFAFTQKAYDPQAEATFSKSKLDWSELSQEMHRKTLALYQDLLALRKTLSGSIEAESPVEGGLRLRRGRHELLVALQDGVTLPRAAAARVRWHSEEARYTAAPDPAEVTSKEVRFKRAGALLLEH